MPRRPRKPCSYPDCPELTYGRYCEKHQKEMEKDYTGSSRAYKHLYKTSRWRILRKQFLRKYPLCVECKRQGVVTAAEVVDHIKPHEGDERLFWDDSNWQALCKCCHDKKTAKNDGRWGSKEKVYSYGFRR
jgi:5-methylcytosine-specific restriction protein A